MIYQACYRQTTGEGRLYPARGRKSHGPIAIEASSVSEARDKLMMMRPPGYRGDWRIYAARGTEPKPPKLVTASTNKSVYVLKGGRKIEQYAYLPAPEGEVMWAFSVLNQGGAAEYIKKATRMAWGGM